MYKFNISQSGSQTIHAGSGKMTKLIDTTGATSGSVSPLRIRENDVTKSAPQASKYLTDPGEASYEYITNRIVSNYTGNKFYYNTYGFIVDVNAVDNEDDTSVYPIRYDGKDVDIAIGLDS